MAINKKLIHFNEKTEFEKRLANDEILDTSIVFVKDSKEIWTHGNYYAGESIDPELLEQIQTSVQELKASIDDNPFEKGDVENSAALKGGNNQTTSECEVALGKYNASNYDTHFSIGIGTSDTNRKNAFEVKQNGDIYIEGVEGRIQDKLDKLVEITYSELKSLRDNSKLIPGQHYRITDYVTTTVQENTQSAGHQFDIIVTADDENTLNEAARACMHDGDTYFADSDLNAWELKYCLDNDTERFAWADAENGKGVIYRMIDEWGNDCPYDFKNIQFLKGVYENGGIAPDGSEDARVHLYTFSFTFRTEDNAVIDTSIFGNNGTLLNDERQISGVYGNVIGQYMNYDGSIDSPTKTTQWLNEIVFYSFYDYDDGLYYGCFSNTFGNNCYSNSFGNKCYSNSFGNNCYSNSFGNGCDSNSFSNYCSHNSFGSDCYSNSFGNYCSSNNFGNECSNNSFGENCSNNSFGENCVNNSFGNDCYENSFGNGGSDNIFGNHCFLNSFENGCENNSLGNECDHNGFGKDCRHNSFGNYCYDNTLGSYCDDNSFGDECKHNSFEDECNYNSFGNICFSNSFGDYCGYNGFGNNCYSNQFYDACYGNRFGNNCYNNSFGNCCNHNSFDNDCCFNSFRPSASTTSSLKNYCHYNHFDDGCSYNVIWTSNTTSSSNVLRNINVNRGVSGTTSNYNFININTINSEKEININNYNGHIYIDYGGIFKVTYSELWNLRENFQLIPGRQYRIIDYNTTTSQENTTSAGHPFDIIVTAVNECTLSEEAQAIQNYNEGYFDESNLSAWKIWYSLDNDTDRFEWADDERIETTTVETIVADSSECTIKSELIDGNTFITPFNFESCVWVDTDSNYADDINNHDIDELIYEWDYFDNPKTGNTELCIYKSDADLYEEEGCADSGDKYVYRGLVTVDGEEYDYWQKYELNQDGEYDDLAVNGNGYVFATTPRIVSNPEAYSSETITETIEIVIPLEPKGVIYRMIDEFGNDLPYDFKNIKFKHDGLGTDVYTFTWIDEDYEVMDTSVFGNNGTLTYLGEINGVHSNVIKPYMTMMYDEDSGEYLGTKQTLNNITFISDYEFEEMGNEGFYGCGYNSFGNDCRNNSFGNDCYSNSFGNECYSNSFGNECYSNSFGNFCRFNSFGNDCYSNSFGYNCRYNSFGSNCYTNSFGNVCYNNSFGNYCHSNSFGNECYNNSFGNKYNFNSFGNYCYSNSFGNYCYYNSFGNYCYSNSFRLSASNTGTLLNYCHNNHFDDGCSYNVIWNSDTISSSKLLKNINVNRGVSGKSSNYNFINIDTLNADYEIQVAKNSKGEIKIYCEADLIA